jgi:tRNA pseudouridine38-40 synthase
VNRWRIVLEYDGAPFAGWQIQERAPTVQGAVEAALEPLVGHPARVSAAGRTDAGVHAAWQVAAFDTSTERTPRAIREGLNARLPSAIACLEAEAVDPSFDPRRSPHHKWYRYTWLVRGSPSPLRRGRVWHVRGPLDVSAMHESIQAIVGTHDLTSFRAQGCTAQHPVRTIVAAEVRPEGDEVRLRVCGVGFLRHTVRILAGTVLEVGRGARPVAWVSEVLAKRDRTRAGRTAPAHGLLLESVTYEDSFRVSAVSDQPGNAEPDTARRSDRR